MIFIDSVEKGSNIMHLSTGDNIKKSLEKAHLSMSFESANDLPIYKTGREVKEKLVIVLNKEEAELEDLRGEIQEQLEEAGIIPTECVSEWQRRELEENEVPKLISYDFLCNGMCDVKQEQGGVAIEQGEKIQLTEEQKKAAREYNRLVDKLVGCTLEVKRIMTVLENLKDEQKVTLSPAMASSLGF